MVCNSLQISNYLGPLRTKKQNCKAIFLSWNMQYSVWLCKSNPNLRRNLSEIYYQLWLWSWTNAAGVNNVKIAGIMGWLSQFEVRTSIKDRDNLEDSSCLSVIVSIFSIYTDSVVILLLLSSNNYLEFVLLCLFLRSLSVFIYLKNSFLIFAALISFHNFTGSVSMSLRMFFLKMKVYVQDHIIGTVRLFFHLRFIWNWQVNIL